MQQFIDQAEHNLSFHACICKEFPDNFYDWKITVSFYIALHYMKAWGSFRGVEVGETHTQIDENINPRRRRKPITQIKTHAWDSYDNLRRYSNTARYNGITDPQTFQEMMKCDFEYCLKDLEAFKKYVCAEIQPSPPAKAAK